MFVVIAYYLSVAGLGSIQCPKTIVNGYDVLVSIISNFQRRQTFQFIRLCWNVIIFEKLIVSLNILVDYIATSYCIFVMGCDNLFCKQSTNVL